MVAGVQSVQKIEGVLGQHAFYRVDNDRFAEQNVVERHFAANDRRKGIVSKTTDQPARRISTAAAEAISFVPRINA